MATRKFFYGDNVSFHTLDAHYGHDGIISQTEIHKSLQGKSGYIMYVVNCECGKKLKVRANQMEQNFKSRKELRTLSGVIPVESKVNFFLRTMGIDENKSIDDVLIPLNEQERNVIEKRFGFGEDQQGHTLEMVGREYGVTRQRIRQIEARAVAKVIHANKK